MEVAEGEMVVDMVVGMVVVLAVEAVGPVEVAYAGAVDVVPVLIFATS